MTTTEPAAQLRVICQGAGYFSQFHYDAWKRLAGAELVATVDLDVDKAAATGAPAFSQLREAILATQPDILDIITPPPTHYATITAAIEAGIKAIICQKPFCESLAQAEQAIALADASGVRLIVHENFRFQPWFRTVKTALDDGLVGDWLQLTFRLRPGDGQGPRAYLDRQPYFQQMPRLLIHETGIHFIDTFRYLLGEPQTVYADLRKMNPVIAGEDAGYFVFGFDAGKRAIFDGNRLLDHRADNHRLTMGECLVEGTAGTLLITGDGAVEHRKFGSNDWEMLLPAQDWPGFAGDCVYAFQEHAVRALRNDVRAETEAADYLRNIKLEELVYRASVEGRRLETVN